MQAALDHGSVLLVAGAGYGKTLALEAAINVTGCRAVWIRCGPLDLDAGRLLRRVVEGVQQVAPGVVDVLAERLASAGQAVDVRLATADFLEAVSRRLDERTILVLDDAEQLAESENSLSLARELLTASYGDLHAAIATRRPLKLRLAKSRSAGSLSEFGRADLAFTPEECGQLLQSLGRPSDEAAARRVFEATDGWPLGATLSALHGDDPRLSGTVSRSEVFAFLREEVLGSLPAELRAQLLRSGVPAELDSVCMAALELPFDLAESIGAYGVPLHPVDASGRWIAHHPLVRELLLEQLALEYEETEVRELHAQVAPVLMAADRKEEAIEHWLAAAAWEQAAKAIAQAGPGLVFIAPATLRAWLDALPDDMRALPSCRLLDGILRWATGDNDGAVEHLRAAVTGFREAGDVPGEWLARFAFIDPLELSGHWDEAMSLADGFDEEPALETGIVPPAVAAYAAAAAAPLGRMDKCRALSRRILAHPHCAPVTSAQALWEADMLIGAGELDAAVAGAQAAVADAERHDPFQRLMTFSAFLASAVTQQGRDREATGLWERVEQLSLRSHMRYLAANTHAWRALLHARNGELGPAEEHLARLRDVPSEGWRDAVAETARARVAALRGAPDEAAAAARRALDLGERGLLTERFQAAFEVAPALLEAGMLPQALDVINRHLDVLDELVPGPDGRYFRAVLLAVRAWLRDAEGRSSESLDDLVAMWREADGRCVAHVIRREWRLLEPLLWKALEAGVLEPRAVVAAVAQAWPGGEALVPLTAHPSPDVRRAAVMVSAGSGHPELIRRLGALSNDQDGELAAAAAAAQRRLVASPPPLVFTVLGDFRVRRGQWWIDDEAWDRRVAQRLVRYLLATRGNGVPEGMLLEAFWPEVDERSSRQRLRVAVSCARAALDVPGAESVIVSAEHTLRLRLREHDSVDAVGFARAAADALAENAHEARTLLEHAARLWTGEPLPQERYSDWALAWRDELTAKYRAVLARLAEVCEDEGDHAAAADAARRLVEEDALDEDAQRLLIRSYARAGKRGHALRQYLDCRRALVDGLGIEPARETAELQHRVLAGDPV
jgi:ATP/maltotriose-dependent transcriptional regulator MalT/DNA-binding SARP family transcriptional activator